MSWARVLRIYVVLALLGGWVLVFERAPSEVDPKNLPPSAEESLLEAGPDAIVSLTFRRDEDEVHVVGKDDRWLVLRPVDANVPSDLLAALVGTLTAGQASEAIATQSTVDLGDYGLVEPRSEIEVAIRGHDGPVLVSLGGLNPTGTAVYAKRGDRDTVFLIGLNVRYYTDLVFAGLRPTS